MKTIFAALASIASIAWLAFVPGYGLWVRHADDPTFRSGVEWAQSGVKWAQSGLEWAQTELGNLGIQELAIFEREPAPAPSRYLTVPVEEGEIRQVVTATGTLNAVVKVEVGSQLSGRIAEIYVDFNDVVNEGQPLAQLDPSSFAARVEEAQAAVNLAKTSISATKAKLERTKIKVHEGEAQSAAFGARRDKARAELDAAEADLRRKEALVKRGSASVVDLEDANTRAASAEADLRESEALAKAHEHEVSGSKAEVLQTESELANALNNLAQKKALLRFAEIELDRTTIRCPVDGVIVGKNVDGGETLATDLEAKTLFVVAGNLRQMQIEAMVDEADISMIRTGQNATFTVDSYPGREFTAEVRQVRKAPEMKQNVVTYTAVLSVANADDSLLPGMTALVNIAVKQTGLVRKVPLAALRFSPKLEQSASAKHSEIMSGRSPVLWVVGENGEPKPVRVSLGDEDGSAVAVVSGTITKGDQIIVGEADNTASKQLFGLKIGL